MTQNNLQSPSYQQIREFFRTQYSLTPHDFIAKGHLNLPILRCEDQSGNKLVVKVGVGEDGKREVLANMTGYQSMAQLNATMMVPERLELVETPWGPAILMQDLGEDYVSATKNAEASRRNAWVLANTLKEVCALSLSEAKDDASKGIHEFKSQLAGWISKLTQNGLIDKAVLSKLESIDVSGMVSDLSTLMILDFTPDNVFIAVDKAVFIDPWKQVTYRGTMLPSIAQFCVLGRDIYLMPGPEAFDNLLGICYQIGYWQKLDDRQILNQIALGTALQFSLSAYVRINSNPDLASKYSRLAVQTINSIG